MREREKEKETKRERERERKRTHEREKEIDPHISASSTACRHIGFGVNKNGTVCFLVC